MALTYKGNSDIFYTPRTLSKTIIEYFNPTGKCLEPASGDGAFLDYMPKDTDWCEITKGVDFFEYKTKGIDWAITNPPFSKIREYLLHLYSLETKNIVFICPISHILGFTARVRDMRENGYKVKEIIAIPRPHTFPQSGFQIAVIHIQKDYDGDIKFSYKEWK